MKGQLGFNSSTNQQGGGAQTSSSSAQTPVKINSMEFGERGVTAKNLATEISSKMSSLNEDNDTNENVTLTTNVDQLAEMTPTKSAKINPNYKRHR